MSRWIKALICGVLAMTAGNARALDPDPFSSRIDGGGYVRPSDVFEWLKATKARDLNRVLKDFAFKEAATRSGHEDAERSALKVAALKNVGWFEEWGRWAHAKVDGIAAKLIQGDFADQEKGYMTLLALEELKAPREYAQTRFWAPLALMRGGLEPGMALDRLAKAPTAERERVAKELLASKLDSGFWFGGVEWEGAPIAQAEKLLPSVVAQARRECAEYAKDDSKDPAHVTGSACLWLVPAKK